MSFEMPRYKAPDFGLDIFRNAPDAAMAPAERDGIVPEGYHSTSMFPEYFKINGRWLLAEESRMDSCVVYRPESNRLDVVEARNIKKGDLILLGRTEHGEAYTYTPRVLPVMATPLRTPLCSVRAAAAKPPTQRITTSLPSCSGTKSSTAR